MLKNMRYFMSLALCLARTRHLPSNLCSRDYKAV